MGADSPVAGHRGTYLGFDYGSRKIGVAVGTLETGTSSPLATLRAVDQKPNWDAIGELVDRWKPVGLVVGLSYGLDGSENTVTRPTLRFCRQLEGRFALPVHRVDETLSTRESHALLCEQAGVSLKKFRQVRDQVSAQLILQTWFHQVCQNP